MGGRLGIDIWEIIFDMIANTDYARTRTGIFEYQNYYMPPHTPPSTILDLKSLSLVCSWFNELACPRLRRSVSITKPNDNLELSSFVISLHWVKDPLEERKESFTGTAFLDALSTCTNLRYLHVENLRFNQSKWREMVLQPHFSTRFENIIALHLANLWPAMPFSSLAQLLLMMPKLSVLTLGEVRDGNAQILAQPPPFHLRSLSFSSIDNEEYTLKVFSWLLFSSGSSLDTLQWPLSRGTHRIAVLRATLSQVGSSLKRMYTTETLPSILDDIVRSCPNLLELGIGHFMNFKNFEIPSLHHFSPNLVHLRFITSIEDTRSARLSEHYFVSDYQLIATTIRKRHPKVVSVKKVTLDFLSEEVADAFQIHTSIIAGACVENGMDFAMTRKQSSLWGNS